MSFKLVNILVKKSDNIITNRVISKVISIILIMYTIFIIPNMLNYSATCTNNIVLIFNNIIFKLLIYLLIGYVSMSNTQLSIFMTIALIITLNAIIKYEVDQYLLNILIKDQINKKELERKKYNELTVNKDSLIKNIPKKTSVNKISRETSVDKISRETSINSISKETSTNKISPINKILDNFETYNNDNINFSFL